MKNKLRCFYCSKLYTTEEKARDCENKHDVVFVPILREDLNRLINFIATGDRNLLTERLSRLLFRYFRAESPK
jgi:hypothetical protein